MRDNFGASIFSKASSEAAKSHVAGVAIEEEMDEKMAEYDSQETLKIFAEVADEEKRKQKQQRKTILHNSKGLQFVRESVFT